MDLLMRDAVHPGAACDAQDAIDEDSADEPLADDSGDSGAVARIWASRQMPEGRTPATGLLRQSSSWPECSTIVGGAIVPEVTAPKEIPDKEHRWAYTSGLRVPLRNGVAPLGTLPPDVLSRVFTLLCGTVMVVVMAMMMVRGSKGRAGKHEDK